MDLKFTPEDDAFRAEVRQFFQNDVPRHITEKVRLSKHISKEDYEEWQALLYKRGWLAQNWPKEFGGAEWSVVQRHIFDEESCLANTPRILPFGLSMLGPVLQKFGNKQQQDYFLPRILSGQDWWCQGYSEPQAGSDLASLRTRAVRDGDHYIVNGQKTWTTLGHYANWIFCLVKTDTQVKPQEGISFLLIDMTSPGVTVRPIILLDGSAEVNEVFLDNVRVPVENLVGEENKGWTYAKYLLTHERTGIAGVGYATAGLTHLKEIAHKQVSGGAPLIENPHFAARLAKVEMDLMAMATTNLRIVAQASSGQAPGAESSMLKIKGTEIRQEIHELTKRALGPQAMPFIAESFDEGYNGEPIGPEYAAAAAPNYFNHRKLSIYGGSNEVQRGIISKAILQF